MGFDLALWKWVEPKPKKINADEVYGHLTEDLEHPDVAPFDRQALHSALGKGFGAESLESVDLVTYSSLYRGLVIHIPWSKVDDVVPLIRKVAAAQGFYCYDPQQSKGPHFLEADKKLEQAEFEQTKEKALAGDSEAQARLGFFYEFGEGVPKNPRTAVTWYAKAAEQGNREAQFNLAGCYRNGNGVNPDLAKAVELYTKLSDQGDEDAMFTLGEMYEIGEGVSKDLKRALALYRRAAEKGVTDAKKAASRLA